MTEKRDLYRRCLKRISGRISGLDRHGKMEVICEVLKEEIPYYFWVGFYLLRGDFLELGPSRGPPACNRIALTGVCGRALKERRAIIVPDVSVFPGHITCDPRSKSEIALPVFNGKGDVIAVLDVDSDMLGSFDDVDRDWLERILRRAFAGD